MGLNILSPTGRAAEARFSQPEMQKLPPDQFMAQLSQEPISMVELMYLKQQYDRLKSAQPPTAPPQTTVADDLRQAVGQAQAQPQQGAGIAALPVPDDMYQTKGMAGGGIVAFAESGSVGGPYEPDLGGPASTRVPRTPPPSISTSGEELLAGLSKKERLAFKSMTTAEKATFLNRLRAIGNTETTAGGLKSLGARGLAAYPYMALTQGAVDAGGMMLGDKPMNQEMPIENIRNYYADKGILPESQRAGAPYESPVMQSLDDLGLRALSSVQRMATLGMTGPRRASGTPAAPAIDSNAGKSDTNADYSEFMKLAGTGGSGYGAIAGVDPSIVSAGFDPVYGEIARQRKAIGPVDDTAEAAEIEKAAASRKAAGIGASTEKADAKNAEAVAALPRDKRRDAWLDAANAFFAAGAAGGQTGSFAEAMSVGALKGVKDYKDTVEYYNQKKERLDDKEMQIGQAREALAVADRAEGKGEIKEREAKGAALDAQQLSVRSQQVTAELNVQMENAKLRAQIKMQEIASAGKEQAAANFFKTWAAIMQSDKSAAVKKAMIDKLNEDMEQFQRSFAPTVIVNSDKLAAAQNQFGGAAAPAAPNVGQPVAVRLKPGT